MTQTPTPNDKRARAIESIILNLTDEKFRLRQQVTALEMKVKGLEKELEEWRNWDGCEHRCGPCDNGKVCAVHDCEASPFYSEANFCEHCGGCVNPHDEPPMGPCDPCECCRPPGDDPCSNRHCRNCERK